MFKYNKQFSKSPLLLWRWYTGHYNLDLNSEQESLDHFLQIGYFNNLNPSPLVNTLWFKEFIFQGQEYGASNLLYDFVDREHINLHPLFSRSIYYKSNHQNVDVRNIENHFIEFGRFDKVNIINCVKFDYFYSKLPNMDLIELISICGDYFMNNPQMYIGDTFNYRNIF